MDPLHISLLYSFLQTAGPYVYATGMSANAAEVHVEVPVENGRSSAQKVELRATVQGPGTRRGGYNSGKIKSTTIRISILEAGINRVAIRATRTAEKVTRRATSGTSSPRC